MAVSASTTPAPAERPPTAGISRGLPEAAAWAALLALGLWAAAPIVYLAFRAAAHRETLSGADSLFAGDQLQYLAWIRSSGEHILAGNGFDLRAGGDVYLQPMFLISGVLWRTGMNIALSYLIWLPVAVSALYVGFRKFTYGMLSSPGPRAAALILALFFVAPAGSVAGWTVGSNGLGVFTGELAPTGALYGYFPIAVAVGLLALFMLGLAQVIDDDHRRRRRRGWYVAWTSAAGLTAAWLHPWQGETGVAVIAGLLVVGRFRRTHLMLLIPAVATLLPLGYYLLLSRTDAAWKLGELQSSAPRPNVLLLALALAPLILLALPGLRSGDRGDPRELILWLWPAASLLVYFVSPGYAAHALEGTALPLSVLAVRGWQRLRWPPWLGAVAIVMATVPGLVFNLQLFHDVAVTDPQGLLLRQDERQALAYLDHSPVPGGVLPSLRIAAAVPAYAGRRTWIGHLSWTPDYPARAAEATALFSGGLSPSGARRFLRQVGARYLLTDCESGFTPAELGPLIVSRHRFGCVTVYRLAVPDRAISL